MRSERGVELSVTETSRLTVFIEMPSGALSIPRAFGEDLEKAVAHLDSFSQQMKTWKGFEAWLVMSDGGREGMREHIKT